jgi:hypothetical protein
VGEGQPDPGHVARLQQAEQEDPRDARHEGAQHARLVAEVRRHQQGDRAGEARQARRVGEGVHREELVQADAGEHR